MTISVNKTKYTSQYIDNMSFDEGLGVKVSELINTSGTLVNPATEETLKLIAIDHDTIVVDTSGANIVVTKKLGGVTVDTKTIQII